eukprot:CAMPEP_0194143914 /NCGR_PEP_ID=MMETSP0152-20130528/13010_1 /TAXON_ID=1049557 /ORGANISM="Thalassiothrix antarctica, Strain L6-D1" /LENGTH=142 /DNA_ID=CAMNT_0038843525 /DNA_START=119 /DNA_END=547 /DNA_ORIENTATION=+
MSCGSSSALQAGFLDDVKKGFDDFKKTRQNTDAWARQRMIQHNENNLLQFCNDYPEIKQEYLTITIKRLENLKQGRFDLDPNEVTGSIWVPSYIVSTEGVVRKVTKEDADMPTELTFNLSARLNLARSDDGELVVLKNVGIP